jgi:hypothetical protein
VLNYPNIPSRLLRFFGKKDLGSAALGCAEPSIEEAFELRSGDGADLLCCDSAAFKEQ